MQCKRLPTNKVISGFEVGRYLSSPREVFHEEAVGPLAFTNCTTNKALFGDLELRVFVCVNSKPVALINVLTQVTLAELTPVHPLEGHAAR
jgi:hypothetical protein